MTIQETLPPHFTLWRYPNRKLFIVGGKDYVNYSDIAKRLREGADMTAVDRRTGEDISGYVLSQICCLETAKGKRQYSTDLLLQAVLNSKPSTRVK